MGESSAPSNERYETLMQEVGEFGHFQKWICALLALSSVPNGYFALSTVFIGQTPRFKCNDSTMPREQLEPLTTSPEAANVSRNQSRQNEPIEFYANRLPVSSQEMNNTCSTGCPNGYVYFFEEGRTSIVTEWDLVCDKDWIMPLIVSIYMSGVLVGSLVSGALADKFGRYPLFMTGTSFMFIFLGLAGVATSPFMFAVFYFFAGSFGFINYVTAFIMASEIINSKDRALTGTLLVVGFAVGYMLLPLFSYFIADWRILCFALASTGVVFIPYFWVISESPRWLYSKNYRDRFSKLFRKIAITNGFQLEYANRLLESFYNDKLEMKPLTETDHHGNDVETTVKVANTKQYSYLDLVRLKKVLPRTLCMWFVWFTCSIIYYGVAFNTSDMGGNAFINCFVAAAVEIPAYALVIVLLKWRGRKPILIGTLLVSGITCAATSLLETVNTELSIALAMIGKFSVSAAFDIGYIVCSELFPTLMRSMAVGSSSMAARVGGMVAPYMLYLGNSNRNVPSLFMGSLGVAAAVFYAFMPETKSIALPETVDDLQSVKFYQCDPLRKKPKSPSYNS